MKKFIQKTTAILMSLVMTVIVSLPAFATAEANEEIRSIEQQITKSVQSETVNEETAVSADTESEEAADDIETETENETVQEEHETETPAENEAAEDEQESPELPEISEEDILDIIQSEEIQDALEDAGVDPGDIEEEIEDGNYEIIYITQEEFEQMRKDEALSVFSEIAGLLGESASLLLLIPATPFLICVPFVGPFMLLIPLAAPVIFVASAVGMVFSPLISYYVYRNYELDPVYEIVE